MKIFTALSALIRLLTPVKGRRPESPDTRTFTQELLDSHEAMARRMQEKYANFPASDPRSPFFVYWARENHTTLFGAPTLPETRAIRDDAILELAHGALLEMVHPPAGTKADLTPIEAAFLENSLRHHLTHAASYEDA